MCVLAISNQADRLVISRRLCVSLLQAQPSEKLPPLYLLDSIAKNVGEPYKSCFGPSLPDVSFREMTHDTGDHHDLPTAHASHYAVC